MRRRNLYNYPASRTKGLKRETKLCTAQVDEIRLRYRHHSKHANCRTLAEEYGVSTTTIHNIVREKKWIFGDWRFRNRSKEPRNHKYLCVQETHKNMEKLAIALLELNPKNPDAIRLYNQYLRHSEQYRNW